MSFLSTTDQVRTSIPHIYAAPPVENANENVQIVRCSLLKTWLNAKGGDCGHIHHGCRFSSEAICYLTKGLAQHQSEYAVILKTHNLSCDQLNNYIKGKNIGAVVDTVQLNYTRHINRYLENLNKILPNNSLYLGYVETNCQRNRRLYRKCNKVVGRICIFCEFLMHRILPKIKLFQWLYFYMTKGKYRFLTTAEALGRMVWSGFKIQDFDEIDNLTYYRMQRIREPYYNEHPSYGPLIKLQRVGKNGRIFSVYKFRTMHPYSEYLQDYFVQHYGYNDCGKPANDFRIAFWGKFMRKYWLDEIPQIINLIKGEMKLVGVRPLSVVRFSEFPKDLQELRIRSKTGCIPPYVALNMPSATDNMKAERIYLSERAEHPVLTDLKYIAMAVYNSLANRIRSS